MPLLPEIPSHDPTLVMPAGYTHFVIIVVLHVMTDELGCSSSLFFPGFVFSRVQLWLLFNALVLLQWLLLSGTTSMVAILAVAALAWYGLCAGRGRAGAGGGEGPFAWSFLFISGFRVLGLGGLGFRVLLP